MGIITGGALGRARKQALLTAMERQGYDADYKAERLAWLRHGQRPDTEPLDRDERYWLLSCAPDSSLEQRLTGAAFTLIGLLTAPLALALGRHRRRATWRAHEQRLVNSDTRVLAFLAGLVQSETAGAHIMATGSTRFVLAYLRPLGRRRLAAALAELARTRPALALRVLTTRSRARRLPRSSYAPLFLSPDPLHRTGALRVFDQAA